MANTQITERKDSGNRALAIIVFLTSLAVLLSSLIWGVIPGFFLLASGIIGLVASWAVSQTVGNHLASWRWPLVLLLASLSIAVIAFVLYGSQLNLILMTFGSIVGVVAAWWLWNTGGNLGKMAHCAKCDSLKEELREAQAEIENFKAKKLLEGFSQNDNDAETFKEAGAPKNLLESRPNQVDDLKRINGVGPVFEKLLNDNGVYHFAQIAAFSKDDVAWIAKQLGAFPDRIARDDWVEQAQKLVN